jgi:hypothetical protein
VTGRWFSRGTPVSSTNKTDRHDITKILFNVALNTITLALLYIAHNVQDCSVLYNNAVRQVICENWHLTRMWKTIGCHIASLRSEVWAHKASLTLPLLIDMPIPNQESKVGGRVIVC